MKDLAIPRSVMGIETECLGAIPGVKSPQLVVARCNQLLEELARIAPSVPGPTGLFHGYGRVYIDSGHLEIATAECDNPFALVSMWQNQQRLIADAVHRLEARGEPLVLANCNHSGLLCDGASTWGCHGNFLVQGNPAELTDLLLPFLATHTYTGAGGLYWPEGDFVASTRAVFLEQERGSQTVSHRALHSAGGKKHHTAAPQRWGYRYHTLSGDGLRSQFSLLLQCGTLALVLQAIVAIPHAVDPLPVPGGHAGKHSFWMRTMHRFNRLACLGDEPRIDPWLIKIQEMYLAAVDRYIDLLTEPPSWMSQVAAIWDATLSTLRRNDQDWLERRLDPWIKYRLFTHYLEKQGYNWNDVRGNYALAASLALLNQNYHEFCNPDNMFAQLDELGHLVHRVVDNSPTGPETTSFVPKVKTRARPRALWIRDHAGHSGTMADWSFLSDRSAALIWHLDDPVDDQLPPPTVRW